MARGRLAPLAPEEEIVLRRIAHGSVAIDARIAARLVALALVERAGGTLRLTPLGKLRFEALPTAPLLARSRSMTAVTGYVSAVIGKAQVMARRPAAADPVAEREPEPAAAPADPTPQAARAPSAKATRETLCEGSLRRIAASRALLDASRPTRPPWMEMLR